jgi:hypothetical protein
MKYAEIEKAAAMVAELRAIQRFKHKARDLGPHVFWSVLVTMQAAGDPIDVLLRPASLEGFIEARETEIVEALKPLGVEP